MVQQRSGRWQACGAAHYRIAVTAAKTGRLPDGSLATHPGVSCLRSSETDWDADALGRTSATRTAGEAVFRSLQSELDRRPLSHRSPRRAGGHLCLTVLADQLGQVLRTRLQALGVDPQLGRVR